MGLDEIREEIDQIDKKLRDLFLQRMELSHKVAETKKLTKADVYAPNREREVLCARTEGVKEDVLPECRAFFAQMMEISRTYQYSKLTEEQELLNELPRNAGSIKLSFSCPEKSRQLPVFINAAVLAGLRLEKAETEKQSDGMQCHLWLSGDFSADLPRGAVLQMLKENETAVFAFIS